MTRFRSLFLSASFCLGIAQSALGGPPIYVAPSGGDDQPAIQAAIDSACASGNTDVILLGGIFNLNSLITTDALDTNPEQTPFSTSSHLVFHAWCNNVSLSGVPGEYVLLNFGHIARGIFIHRSRDTRIEHLAFDWPQHPFGQGTVQSVDAPSGTIWVTNDSGYAPWSDAMFLNDNWPNTYLMRTNRGNTHPNCEFYKQASPDQTWWPRHGDWPGGLNWFQYSGSVWYSHYTQRYYSDTCPDGIGAGDKVILNRGGPYTHVIQLIGAKGAMLRDLNIYASPGGGIFNEHSERGTLYPQINMIAIIFAYHPTDSSRTISVNANPIYSTGSRAALYIADSLFYGQGDDAIDFHARAGNFVGFTHNGTNWVIQYSKKSMGTIHAGETLEIVNPAAGEYRCTVVTVAAAERCGDTNWGEPQHCVAFAIGNPSCPNYMAYFDGTNPNTSDRIVNVNETWDAVHQIPTVIENNHFYGSRGRAILNRGWNTIIRSNEIGSWYYGRPNFEQGIVEGICGSDSGYDPLGSWNWPGRDNQMIYWNTGVFENRVDFCRVASTPEVWWP